MDWLAKGLCSWRTRIFCTDLLFVLAGYDPAQLNATRVPVYVSHTPAGTSVQNMIHFAQVQDLRTDTHWQFRGERLRAQILFSRLPFSDRGISLPNPIYLFVQMVRSNKFQMFDYGSAAKNKLHYGRPVPPLYDITAVNVTTSLYWGGKDLLADPRYYSGNYF